jgi:hypothetical protein
MLFRYLFANFGKSAKPSTLVRVVKDGEQYVPYTEWKRRQFEAEAQAKRMATSEKEPFDYTYKAPSYQKLDFDFSQ